MLIGFLLTWALTALALWLVTRIVSGVRVRGTRGLLLAALVLGLANAFVRPILWFMTLPLTVLTFGLFSLVINALMIRLTAWLVSEFEVDSFGSALLAAVIMALLCLAGYALLQWAMLGSVHWLHMDRGRPLYI